MRRRSLVVLAALGLMLPSCDWPLAPYSASSISGRVQVLFQLSDPNGTPLGVGTLDDADGVVVYLTGPSRRDSTRTKGGAFRFDQVAIGDWFVGPSVGGVITDSMHVGIRSKADRIRLLAPLRLQRAGELIATPNPFSAIVSVQFPVPATMPARLQVVGLNGTLRRVVLEQTFVAGRHIVSWDGTDASGKPLPDGSYAFVLLAGSERRAEMVMKGDGSLKTENAWRSK